MQKNDKKMNTQKKWSKIESFYGLFNVSAKTPCNPARKIFACLTRFLCFKKKRENPTLFCYFYHSFWTFFKNYNFFSRVKGLKNSKNTFFSFLGVSSNSAKYTFFSLLLPHENKNYWKVLPAFFKNVLFRAKKRQKKGFFGPFNIGYFFPPFNTAGKCIYMPKPSIWYFPPFVVKYEEIS